MCWYLCFVVPFFCVPLYTFFFCCKTSRSVMDILEFRLYLNNSRCVFCGRRSTAFCQICCCCGHRNEACYQENSHIIDAYPDSTLYQHRNCGYPLKIWPKHKLPSFKCRKCKEKIENDGGNAHICFRCEDVTELRLCDKHNFGKKGQDNCCSNFIHLGQEQLKVDFDNLKSLSPDGDIIDV